MPNASKTRALTLLAATFVAGVAVGTGVRAVWAHYSAERRSGARPGLDRMMANLNDELHLTPVQHDSVHAILGRHFGELTAVWDSVKPRFDAIRSRMDSEVVRQLTPTQAVQYRNHVTRYRHQKEQAQSDSSRKKP
jgi:hypothetical protein